MLRQGKSMSGLKRERWTEAEVLAFPSGEHDYFDRKSGSLLTDQDFRKDMAKAISAFANSGGGHLLLGVKDDGTFDGVPPVIKGRMPTRQWLEQIIPNLVSFPLEDFRVHEVEPSRDSSIPAGTVVIVIDIGDSALAPHQSESAKVYFCREGGHSKPAPHFYLETLRNRLVSPHLDGEITGLTLRKAYPHDGGVFAECVLHFSIKNEGKTAAYKWALVLEKFHGAPDDRLGDYVFDTQKFPKGWGGFGGVRLDVTILPSMAMSEERPLGLVLRPRSIDQADILPELEKMLPTSFELEYRVVSETSRGEASRGTFPTALVRSELASAISTALSS